ncbi:unnamed protein product [Rotaria sp. Silwood2]|nr:unnamed protein product [Rotaria sp. Silwood2]CAF2815508.1 unnamed protein product [Rotaria sp. Silwood2]CAF2898282.1 unnamed protein product [Rotaria sp. Silwood2]CAF3928921.1 unnamed protein product [Rotaria sp. Silwood2]CAF4489396.1 unnamed protein product [Rotaria sp. Silwood2]
MISTEAKTQNQSQQSTTYDERVFNERIRQLFNSIDSSTVLSPNNNINQMTSIVDALFPEQASLYQQQQQQHDQRRSSTNDLTTAFDRFSLWNNHNNNNNNSNNNSSASAFCGGTTNGSSAFTNRRQSTLHSSSRSLRNTYHHHQQQQQQQYHYRPPPVTRPRFTSSSIRIPSAATITAPSNNYTAGLQRSASSLSTNNTSATMDYQPRFASRLSTTRLPSAAPAGSHDQIAGNNNTIDPIAPSSSSIDVTDQTCSASAVLSRNTSTTNVQPQQFVTMTQTTTTTFCYVPASGSLAYNNLAGTGRSTTVSHH